MNKQEEIETLMNMLAHLRQMRDKSTYEDGIRNKYNTACDRLDALISHIVVLNNIKIK